MGMETRQAGATASLTAIPVGALHVQRRGSRSYAVTVVICNVSAELTTVWLHEWCRRGGQPGVRRATWTARGSRLGTSSHQTLVGADPVAAMAPGSALEGRVNYLVGDDPRAWHTGAASPSATPVSSTWSWREQGPTALSVYLVEWRDSAGRVARSKTATVGQ